MSQDTTFTPVPAVPGPTTDPSNLPAPAVAPDQPPVQAVPIPVETPAPPTPVVTPPVAVVTPPADVPAPPAPVAPGLMVGQLVSYRHRDTVTGTDLTGAGVIVRVADTGSVRVAPLSIYTIDALPELVAPLDAALLDVLA